MNSEFIKESEQDYLISKAELIRARKRILATALAIKQAFGYNENSNVQQWTGQKIEIPVILDEVNLDKFERIIPEVRKYLAEYHRLRGIENEIDKRLRAMRIECDLDVIGSE